MATMIAPVCSVHAPLAKALLRMLPSRLVEMQEGDEKASQAARATPATLLLPPEQIESLVQRTINELSAGEVASVDVPLMEAGIDSLAATELSSRLRTLTGVPLSPTLVFEQPTARAISTHLLEHARGAEPVCVPSIARREATAAPQVQAANGRWPGGNGIESSRWALMQASGDAVGNVSSRARWTLSEAVDASLLSASQLACARHGGFVAGADRFANTAFRVSPAEAEVMDPQQRMLLEAGYAGLHSAGQRRATLVGGDGGVFVGIERPDWALLQALRRSSSQGAPPSAFAVTADTVNVASGRLSFVLGLQGPCSSVDTACSSTLVALHGASSALAGGECGVAVVLAVSLKLMPQPTLGAAAAGMLSSDGRCKTLDWLANGYVRN